MRGLILMPSYRVNHLRFQTIIYEKRGGGWRTDNSAPFIYFQLKLLNVVADVVMRWRGWLWTEGMGGGATSATSRSRMTSDEEFICKDSVIAVREGRLLSGAPAHRAPRRLGRASNLCSCLLDSNTAQQ